MKVWTALGVVILVYPTGHMGSRVVRVPVRTGADTEKTPVSLIPTRLNDGTREPFALPTHSRDVYDHVRLVSRQKEESDRDSSPLDTHRRRRVSRNTLRRGPEKLRVRSLQFPQDNKE